MEQAPGLAGPTGCNCLLLCSCLGRHGAWEQSCVCWLQIKVMFRLDGKLKSGGRRGGGGWNHAQVYTYTDCLASSIGAGAGEGKGHPLLELELCREAEKLR